MNVTCFTSAELRILNASDACIDVGLDETPSERNARQSRESRERRRMRMGDESYRAMCRARMARWKAAK